MRKLNYDYFVWGDGDTKFDHVPVGLLEPVRHSPIYAPLLRRWCEEEYGGSLSAIAGWWDVGCPV